MNEDEKLTDVNEITELLIRLRPARSELDSRVVFYEAGFNACQSQQPSRGLTKHGVLIAVAFLTAVVTAPLSYRVGRTAAVDAASGEHVDDVAMTGATEENVASESMAHNARGDQETSSDDDRATTRKPGYLAKWIDPFSGLTEFTRIERGSQTTLTASHSTFAFPEDTGQDWLDLPFSTTLARYRDSFGTTTFENSIESMSPLTVSDSKQLARTLESTR